MDIRVGLLAVMALSGCATAPAPATPLPAGTVISMSESQMGATLGSIVLAPDNSVDVAISDEKFPVPILSRYRGTVDARTAAAARAALAPWFLGRAKPQCENPVHDAPGLSVSARIDGAEVGTAHAFFGCQGKAYAAYSATVAAQYRALKAAARLETTPYATAPARN